MAKYYTGYQGKDFESEYMPWYKNGLMPLSETLNEVIDSPPLRCDLMADVHEMTLLEKDEYTYAENGYCMDDDGSIRVAVHTQMPGVSPAMWDWWFGWHGSEDLRYKLWHPAAHVSAVWQDGKRDSCYIGRNSIIREYIGPHLLEASIQFKSPLEFGFSSDSVNHVDKVVYICAKIGHPVLSVDYGYLVHQVRATKNGCEMRSRFWLGGKYAGLRKEGSVSDAVSALIRRFRSLPSGFAKHLLQHCAEEMNHLAGVLPDLYTHYVNPHELQISGQTFLGTDAGFPDVMKDYVYNKADHGRKPAMIVEPRHVEDVIRIVKYAKQAGLRLTVLSGGRSFSVNSMRDEAIVISMKHFNTWKINHEEMSAEAGPAVGGYDLMKALYKQKLFFPAGHCKGVCLGGYLLQGGYGWNGRKTGIACKSVVGMDIVTANGEYVHASESVNADLFWAARGSGPGFFGVVTRFYLRLYTLPAYRAIIAHDFSIKHVEDVYRWAYDIGPSVPASVEFQMLMNKNMMNVLGPGIEAFAPIFADNRDEFEEAKAFMQNSPLKKKAMITTPAFNPGIDIFYKATMTHYPAGYKYGVDNMWTHATIDELMPHIKEIAEHLPPAPSHFLWLNWYPQPLDTDMAYSMEDNIYLALYSCWKTSEDNERYGDWSATTMQKMQHLSTGIQLADEGLHKRTAPFMLPEHLKKVQQIREKWDPEHLFFEWHNKPA